LNKVFGFWIKTKNDTSTNDDSDSEVDNLKDKSKTEMPFDEAPNDGMNERIARALKQTSKLKVGSTQIQQDSSKILIQEGKLVLEKADITLNLIASLKELETFEDAYYHPNFEERMKWREEIPKEFDEIKEKGF
jgi:hypothetical protein